MGRGRAAGRRYDMDESCIRKRRLFARILFLCAVISACYTRGFFFFFPNCCNWGCGLYMKKYGKFFVQTNSKFYAYNEKR